MTDAIGALVEAERLPPDYCEVAERFWRPLAACIAHRHESRGRQRLLVGVNGAQGSGKTTSCRFLEPFLSRLGLTAVTLSLDDLYLTQAERRDLARDQHPLFATRGVPGTHDVDLGMDILDNLLAGRSADLPRFDKARDDRAPGTMHVGGPVDVVLFEGWCVGAAPQPAAALATPVNSLEAEEDPEAAWRREVNRRLATDYAGLFARIDLLAMLKVADFAAVRANRRRQEAKLGAGPAVMDEAALDRFLMHYERLTRWQLEEMPQRADIVLAIGPDQRPLSARPPLPTPAESM